MSPCRRPRGEAPEDVAAARRRVVLVLRCQLLGCHLFTRCDGASACNPAEKPPVEPARPHFFHYTTSYHLSLIPSAPRLSVIPLKIAPGAAWHTRIVTPTTTRHPREGGDPDWERGRPRPHPRSRQRLKIACSAPSSVFRSQPAWPITMKIACSAALSCRRGGFETRPYHCRGGDAPSFSSPYVAWQCHGVSRAEPAPYPDTGRESTSPAGFKAGMTRDRRHFHPLMWPS